MTRTVDVGKKACLIALDPAIVGVFALKLRRRIARTGNGRVAWPRREPGQRGAHRGPAPRTPAGSGSTQ